MNIATTLPPEIKRLSFHELLQRFLDYGELPWVLTLGAFAMVLPNVLPDIWLPPTLLLLLSFWPARWLIRGQQTISERRIYTWPFYILVCWLPINILIANVQTIAWQQASYLLVGMALYRALIKHPILRRSPSYLGLSVAVIGSILILLCVPAVQWKNAFRLFYVPFYDLFLGVADVTGETIHANVLAGTLVLLAPLVIALTIPAPLPIRHVYTSIDHEEASKLIPRQSPSYQKQWRRVLWICIAMILVVLLVLTQSRGGYLAFGATVACLTVLRWPRFALSIPLFLGLVLFGIYKLGAWNIFDLIGADNTFGGSEWRVLVWSASVQAVHDFAWTGIGIGNFRQVLPLLYPNPAIDNEIATHAHNLLLQIWIDLGLVGLTSYIAFYATIIYKAGSVLQHTRTPQTTANILGGTWDQNILISPPTNRHVMSNKRFVRQVVHLERTRQLHWSLAAGCLAALVGMQVHGLLDAVTWGNKLAFIPWLIFAQITLLYHYHTAPSIAAPGEAK